MQNLLFLILLTLWMMLLATGGTTTDLDTEEVDSSSLEERSGSPVPEPAPIQKLTEWINLKVAVRKASGDDEYLCTANENLTHAHYLLEDLIHFHRATGILAYGWPRSEFYDSAFRDLHSTVKTNKSSQIFCLYKKKLVCMNGVCVKCDAAVGHETLAKACRYAGDGGSEAEVNAEKVKEIPGPLTPPPLTTNECENNWLTTDFVTKRFESLNTPQWQKRKPRMKCKYYPQMTLALAHLVHLENLTEQDRQIQFKQYRYFYEDRLRVIKNRKPTGTHACYFNEETESVGGPFVCGKDSRCILCAYVENSTVAAGVPPELVEACDAFYPLIPKEGEFKPIRPCNSGVAGGVESQWWSMVKLVSVVQILINM